MLLPHLAVGEGAEEVAAELVDPLAKSIYKGKDAFSEYGSGEYWKGVGKAGLAGAAVSSVYGGAFDVVAGGVKAGDINAAKADINATVTQSENLKEKNRFTEERAKRADSQTLGNLKIIEKTLKSVDEGKRAELIKKNGLSGMFAADGSLDADIENSLANGSGLDRRYYSESERGNEKVIKNDISQLNAELQDKFGDKAKTIDVYNGELSEKGQTALAKIRKVQKIFNQKSGKRNSIIVTDKSPNFNGKMVDDSRMYIAADTLEHGTWAGTFVHENMHFAEGTEEYNRLVKLLESDTELDAKAVEKVFNKSGYGFDKASMLDIERRLRNGETVENGERRAYQVYREEVSAHASEMMLGTESFIDKVIRTDASLAEKIIGKIKDLKEAFGRIGDPEAQAQHKRLAEAEKLYLKAIEAAGKKFENGKIVSAGDKEDENISNGIYSFKTSQSGMANDVLIPYNEEITAYIRQQGNYIVYDFEMLKRVVDLAFDNPNLKATIYFGSIDTKTLDKIENSIPNLPQEVKGKLFKNNSNYSIAATFDSIRHIVDEKKLSREDVLDYLDHLADTIVDFDSVTFDYYIKGNEKNPGLLFKKQFSDGKYISFDFVSQKKRSLMMQSLYLDNVDYQKRKSANALLMRNASTSTPEAQAGQTPTNRVSQNFNSVNPKSNFSFKEDSDNNKNTAFNNENKQSDNKKPTSYTKAEAEAMVDGIMKNLFISDDYGGVWTSGELKNRAAVIKQAHAVLNGAEAGKRFGEALKFADYIIEHTALVENVDGNILEPCIQTLDTLRPYLHKLNLDNLKGEIQHHYDKDRSVYSRWSKRKGHCKFYVGC